jgi:two-component system chemotaxis sensor kinase CheA
MSGDGLDEILAIFFEECAEGLTVAEQGLSAMADGDTSADVIAGVFRAVHSIKGGSGAFGHNALMGFSHSFENVLDDVRSGQIAPTPDIMRILLNAFDLLSDHVAAAQSGDAVPADADMLAQLDALREPKGAPAAQPAAPVPQPVVAAVAPVADEFGFTPVLAEIEDFDPFGFEPVSVDLSDLTGDAGPDLGSQDWIVRFGPTRAAMANGSEPMLVIRELESMGGRITDVDLSSLPSLRDLDPEDAYFVWTLALPAEVDEQSIRECFDFVSPDALIEIERAAPEQAEEAADPDFIPFDVIPVSLDLFAADIEPVVLEAETAAPEPAPVAAPAPAPAPAAKPKADVPAQTIRVDLGKLDSLLNLVGELVIRGSILSDRLSPADQERVELPELSRLTRQIQDNVMSLRAQPIRQAFSRVPRLLRDLMAETGKQVTLETTGEMTEVDKGVIEKIGDPLTHMIRNAMDHGIESPEERIAAGKSPNGNIRLSAEQKGARIIVRVSDDGRGINRERVRGKAIERGIIAPDAVMTDEEIDSLICAPGFSTAENISAISGRGVGMDVVRSNVEALGGRLEIRSHPGQGTSFAMALPLTLAILDGMIVRLGERRYVLPLANVIETIQPMPGQVMVASPTSEVIEVRGTYLPMRRVGDLFGVASTREPEDSLVIIVESETAGHVGLMVDTIDNRREVVIKSLEDNLHPIRGLGGATVLGDGSIALILDIDALVVSTGPKFALKGVAA